MTDTHKLPLETAVQNECDRIYRAIHMRGVNDREDVISYAKEVVGLRRSLTALKQED